MDVYHIWFNLKPGVRDLGFVESARAYLDHLKEVENFAACRITRCKLGLAPPQFREWNIALEFKNLMPIRSRAFATRSTLRSRTLSLPFTATSPTRIG